MIVAREDELVRLRRQVRELQDELAEWRRQDREGLEDAAQLARIRDTRRKLGVTAQGARVLLKLLDTSPSVLNKERLFNAMACPGGDTVEIKIVDVYVCKLRAALERGGLHDIIETAWGLGYSIPADRAAALRERLGL